MNKFLDSKILQVITRFSDVMGPVIVSALSILISFCILQPLFLWMDPSFSLLANRGAGKILFTILVLLHIMLLLTTTPKKFLVKFVQTNFGFIRHKKWIAPFCLYFLIFFSLHSLMLYGLSLNGIVQTHPEALNLIPSKIGPLVFGFIATFFLAWTEEVIFRGALFSILKQKISPLSSIIITSLIFSLAHNVTNPLLLVTSEWRLGLGLFLLGMFLNILFFLSNALYIGMGAHAGLVFVKVLLRRIPLITYAPVLPWWFDIDLRQSLLTHSLFLLIIVFLLIVFRREFNNHAQ